MGPGDFLIGKIKAYIKIQKLKRAVQFKTCLTSGFMLFSRVQKVTSGMKWANNTKRNKKYVSLEKTEKNHLKPGCLQASYDF